jgi:hypothetical protein
VAPHGGRDLDFVGAGSFCLFLDRRPDLLRVADDPEPALLVDDRLLLRRQLPRHGVLG